MLYRYTSSHLNSNVNPDWAWKELGLETSWETGAEGMGSDFVTALSGQGRIICPQLVSVPCKASPSSTTNNRPTLKLPVLGEIEITGFG